MSSLQQTLSTLANDFANQILETIQGSSLEELTAVNGKAKSNGVTHHTAEKPEKSSGRLARRSIDDIKKVVADIQGLLAKKPDGMRAEDIREALGLEAKEMPRVLKQGVSDRVFKTKGQKRATTYFLTGKSVSKTVKTASRKARATKVRKAKPKKATKPQEAKAAE